MSAWSLDRNKLVSLVVTVLFAQLVPNSALAQTTPETPSWEALTEQAKRLEAGGDLRQAEKVFKQAYQISKTFEGADVRRMMAMENFGRTLELEGRYTTAQSMFQEALELRQKEYGDDSPRLSKSFYNIGRVQLLAGDYLNARTNLTKALNSRQFSSSEEKNQQDLPLVFILFNLGVLETETGNFAKAEEYLNRCQTIAQNIAKHKESARVLSQLALLSLAEQDFAKAENQACTSLSVADKFAKDDVLVRAQALNTVAMVKLARGELKEATNASNESWNLKRKVLGTQHPLTADSLLTAGLIKLAEKKYEGAEKNFDDALGVYNNTLNQQHLSHSRALIGRAFSHLKQSNAQASKRDLDQGVAYLAASTGAAKHLPAKYKDLYVEKIGVAYSWIDMMKEKVKTPGAQSSGQFDVFGQLLSMSLADKEDADTFYSVSYKDLFTVLGVTFVVLILLAMAVLIPGVFAFLFPWGRHERGRSTQQERTRTVEPKQETASGSLDSIRRPVQRRTTESERRQIQVWKGRLNTMETDHPQAASTGKSSGTYDRIDFQPNTDTSSTMHLPLQLPPSQASSTEGNSDQFKW